MVILFVNWGFCHLFHFLQTVRKKQYMNKTTFITAGFLTFIKKIRNLNLQSNDLYGNTYVLWNLESIIMQNAKQSNSR